MLFSVVSIILYLIILRVMMPLKLAWTLTAASSIVIDAFLTLLPRLVPAIETF